MISIVPFLYARQQAQRIPSSAAAQAELARVARLTTIGELAASIAHEINQPLAADAEKWAKEFDNPERDAWQKPEEILDVLHLQRTSLVADIGAGTGYFSVRIAKARPGRQNICRRYRAGHGALSRRTSAT